MTESFGARLRAERQRRGVALEAIAHSTKISAGLFEALERDDPSRWPSGIFRRAFIRAYAAAIGLDPEATLREFLERFPDPADERPPALVSADRGGAAASATAAPAEPLRLTLADDRRFPIAACARALGSLPPRAAAAACDLAVVLAIAGAIFAIAGVFWTPFTLATVCYYFGGVLIAGNSPAAWTLSRGRLRAAAASPQAAAAHHPPRHAGADVDNVTPFRTRRHPKAVSSAQSRRRRNRSITA